MTRLVRFAAIAAVALVCILGAQSVRAQETCFGIPDNDPDVCSGNGICIAPDTCSCYAGYAGPQCEFVTCFSIPDNDPNVCSGHGACIGPDTCSCDAGYTGNECQYAVCFGVPSSDPSVCSGHGTCTGPDTCSCQVGFIGDECESLVIQTVTVGNPGNVDDTHGDGYGGVDYEYRIGTFEVTAGQYRDFLNAVDPAGSNPYGLYNSAMDSDSYGCQITWNGSSYDFSGGTVEAPGSTAADWANRPVHRVSWGDAARFCNWLHNGQPTGQLTGDPTQDAGLTEDGSYYLNGATSDALLLAIVREPDATWVIPSEDEWYKAAYHYNNGVTGNYFDYPTSTDSVPSNDWIDPDPGNNANFSDSGYSIGSPYYRTVVGDFENSESPYDTFDQGGNVGEWNEAIIGSYRGVRGGNFFLDHYDLHAEARNYNVPTSEGGVGFRVAEVEPPPIPAVSEWGMVTMALLVLTAGTLVWARRGMATV